MRSDVRKLLVILDCCVGCHACEIACRQEHDLTPDTSPPWCRVVTVRARRVGDEVHLDYFPIMCAHCEDPLCARCCPSGAIVRREDGTIEVDGETCDGCKLCVYACPYGVMHLNEATKVAGHCDLCRNRVEWGFEPSCVQHCIGGALRYVTEDELDEITKDKHTVSLGNLCYASSKWRLSM